MRAVTEKFCYLAVLTATFAAALLMQSQPASALEVLDVRVGFNDETRVVIETDKSVQAKVFTLPAPPRLVVDLPTVRDVKVNLASVDLPPRGVVKGVRDGIFNRSTHRLVFDLTASANQKKFTIAPRGGNQFRTVIDLTPRSDSPTVKKDVPSTSFTHRQSRKSEEKKKQPDVQRDFVVVIDAGHGGIDPGAVGKRNTYEKDIVLEVSRRTVRALNRQQGVKAHLTRDSDTFLRLQERVDKAKDLNADIFVSLHADALDNPRVRGGSVYVLSESASQREAERLSVLANRGVSPISGLEQAGKDRIVKDILIDLAQRDTMNNSSYLARAIIDEMDQVTYMRRKDILFAGFMVLKAPDIPSILVELAYMSNPAEERKLRQSTFQQKLANAVADGIVDYIRSVQ